MILASWVLDYELNALRDSLARARKRADNQAKRLNQRHEPSDRLVCWYERRIALLTQVRAGLGEGRTPDFLVIDR